MYGAHFFQGEAVSQSQPREANNDNTQQPSTQAPNLTKKRILINNKVVLEIKQLVESGLTFREIGAKLGYAAATVNRKYLEYCKFRLPEDDAPKHNVRVSLKKNDIKPLIMDLLFRDMHLSLPKIQRKLSESGTTYNIHTLNNRVAGPVVNFSIKKIKTATTTIIPTYYGYTSNYVDSCRTTQHTTGSLCFYLSIAALSNSTISGWAPKNPRAKERKAKQEVQEL